MIHSKFLFLSVFLYLILFSSQTDLAETNCITLFVKDMFNTNKIVTEVLKKCSEIISKADPDNNQCLTCNERVAINLFEFYNTDLEGSLPLSFCMGTDLSCTSENPTTPQVSNLFQSFVSAIESADELKALTGLTDIEIVDTFQEKDQTIPAGKITGQIVRHTGQFITYTISSDLDYPVKCYKHLDYETDPPFESGDMYYVLKAKTKDRLFTEYFKASTYDCKDYKMFLKCNPVPYQENVKEGVVLTLFEVTHSKEDTVCEYREGVQPQPEPEEEHITKQEVPTLVTDDPMKDHSAEVNEILGKEYEERVESLESLIDDLKNDELITNDLAPLYNMIIKSNQVLEGLFCDHNETKKEKNCNATKVDLQEQCWKTIDDSLNNKTILGSLDPSGENYESNVKILLETMITSFKNPETFNSKTTNTAVDITTKTLNEALDLIANIDNNTHITDKASVKGDLISLLTATASSVLQVVKEEDSKKDFVKNGNMVDVRESMRTVAKVLLTNGITEDKLNNLEFRCTKAEDDAGRRLETEHDGQIVYNFTKNGIDVVVPTQKVKEKFAKEKIIGYCVINYANYPFITGKGLEAFYRHVISVEAFVENEKKDEDIVLKVKDLEEDSMLQVIYRKNFLNTTNTTFNSCYIFDYEDMKEPKEKNTIKDATDEIFLNCKCSMFGDVLVGDFDGSGDGLAGWAIFLIVLASLIGAVGIAFVVLWQTGLYTKVGWLNKIFSKILGKETRPTQIKSDDIESKVKTVDNVDKVSKFESNRNSNIEMSNRSKNILNMNTVSRLD